VARLVDGLIVLAIIAALFVPAFVFDEMGSDVAAGTFGVLAFLAYIFGPLVYETVLIGRWGKTLGKRLMGISVVTAAGAQKVSFGSALGRAAVVWVGGWVPLLVLIVFAWAFWDDRNQGLHDKVAGTIVISDR
jgi:uncharacterized RDD family membrane protein YckC